MTERREETDFAAWRFPQRMARDVSYYYPGRHYKPEHHVPWRAAVCVLAAGLIGWLAFMSL